MNNEQLDMVKMTASIVAQAAVNNALKKANSPKMLYGLHGLADFLKVSVRTAMRYKKEGRVPFKRIGGKLFFEIDKVLEAMEVNSHA
jgi:hypothetical protein